MTGKELWTAERVSIISDARPQRDVFASGTIMGTVGVWGEGERSLLSVIDTTLESEGERMVLLNAKRLLLITANYSDNCVSCYDAEHGNALWHVRTLRQVVNVGDCGFGRILVEHGKSQWSIIDGCTGILLHGGFGLGDIKYLPSGKMLVGCSSSRKFVAADVSGENNILWSLSGSGRSMLWAASSPTTALLSEMCGLNLCVSLNDGKLLWSYQCPDGFHLLVSAWLSNDNAWYGVAYNYASNVDNMLIRLDFFGCSSTMLRMPRNACVTIASDGSRIIAGDGEMVLLPSIDRQYWGQLPESSPQSPSRE